MGAVVFFTCWFSGILVSGWLFKRAHRPAWIGLVLGAVLSFIGVFISLAVLLFYSRQPDELEHQLHVAALENDVYGDIVSPEARRALQRWYQQQGKS